MTIANPSLDPITLDALNDITALLQICQGVSSMANTFGNAEGLDYKAAKPHARKVLRFTRRASATLLEAAFHPEAGETTPEALAKARKSAGRRLDDAFDAARYLAAREIAWSKEVGGKGNVIAVTVIAPLMHLATRWGMPFEDGPLEEVSLA